MSKRSCVVAFDEQLGCVVALKNQGSTQFFVVPATVDALAKIVKEQGLVNLEATLLLPNHDFQLRKVRKPAVASGQLKEALILQEQHQFSQNIGQLAIEYFDCPLEPQKNQQNVFLFSTNQEGLKSYFQLLERANFKVSDITIPVLSYGRYLQAQFPEKDLIVLCHLFKNFTQAQIFYKGALFEVVRLPFYQENNMKELVATLTEKVPHKLARWEIAPQWIINSGLWEDQAKREQFKAELGDEVKGLEDESLGGSECDRCSVYHDAVFGAISL